MIPLIAAAGEAKAIGKVAAAGTNLVGSISGKSGPQDAGAADKETKEANFAELVAAQGGGQGTAIAGADVAKAGGHAHGHGHGHAHAGRNARPVDQVV
jgi:hypothetical protein